MRLSEIYVAWTTTLASLVVDVGEKTHLKNTLTQCRGSACCPLGGGGFLLVVKELEECVGEIHLVYLV